MEPTGIAEEHPGVTRYRRIEKEIQKLKWFNIKKASKLKKATEILQEGEVTYPTEGPSIFENLVGKTKDLYQKESFASLVKELYSSYQTSAPLNKEEVFDIIWQQFGRIRLQKKADVEKTIAKIKIFVHLDDSFGSRFLAKFIDHRHSRRDFHAMDILIFLVREGADPFLPIDGTVSFTLFLELLNHNLNDTTMQSVETLLEKASKYVSRGEEIQNNILNDVVKAHSLSTYRYSSRFSYIKDLVFMICLEMIEKNPASCDHVDGEGRTPLQNLMEKLEKYDLWRGSDSLWNLMSQLITEKNVNIKDKNQQTPYSLFLKRFGPHLNDISLPSFTTFLEEVFKKLEVSTEECVVNEVIKSVPKNILESISNHSFSAVKELIVENCLNMIQTNPALCDHVDREGRTSLHNLMDKLFIGGLWKTMPGFVAGTDSLLNLMSQLITEKNVNRKDKDLVTPFIWILLWQEIETFYDVPDNQKSARKVENMMEDVQKRETSEKDETRGLQTLR